MYHKRCSKCNKLKALTQFHKQSKGKFGVRPDCKICRGQKFRKVLTAADKKAYRKAWENRNKLKLQKYRREYHAKQYAENIEYRLKANLRQRVRKALKFGKPESTIKALGCSVKDLMQYLESKFVTGMSWKNYGKWHVDHVQPLCSFDLAKKQDYLKACHYTNLQPLWANENRKKSKVDRKRRRNSNG